MEPSTPPTIAKRLWHIVQVVYYMLRKGISKRKLMLDLHLLLKRGKLAGKALGNLLMTFHHHAATDRHFNPKEVEFSCSNTPSYAYYFHATSKRKRRLRRNECDSFGAAEMAKVFEMMNVNVSDTDSVASSAFPTPSPMLGLGKSPMMVRQLRITDSPFPIQENEVVDVGKIDKEADEFIKMFYEQLWRQQLASAAATPDYAYCRRPAADDRT